MCTPVVDFLHLSLSRSVGGRVLSLKSTLPSSLEHFSVGPEIRGLSTWQLLISQKTGLVPRNSNNLPVQLSDNPQVRLMRRRQV